MTRLEGRKAQILDTAMEIAFESGPDRVTTVAIAERLGLTQPAIYRHFRSKADLWAAITERLGAQVAANMARAEAAGGPALDRLRLLVLGHLELVRCTPALPEIVVARNSGGADAVVRTAMQARMAGFQQMLQNLCQAALDEGTLRADIEARDLATLVMGVMQSLVLRLLVTRNPARIVEDGAHLYDLQIAAFARQSET